MEQKFVEAQRTRVQLNEETEHERQNILPFRREIGDDAPRAPFRGRAQKGALCRGIVVTVGHGGEQVGQFAASRHPFERLGNLHVGGKIRTRYEFVADRQKTLDSFDFFLHTTLPHGDRAPRALLSDLFSGLL